MNVPRLTRRAASAVLVAGIAVLAGCSTVVKIEGEQTLRGRLTVQVGQAWNRLAATGLEQPYEVWTQEGLSLDHLRLWPGIQSGESLMAVAPSANSAKTPRVPVFRAGMAPDQLAHLFELLYSADGSAVRITRIEPVVFAGERGLRLELLVVRPHDEVHLSVAGWVAERRGELYALTYAAPRLGFFRRGLPGVEALVASARIR
ncbi:MAG: hypothetical protein RL522_1213 [Pseudomonadota bacterium]|jgi:hypothetical protein